MIIEEVKNLYTRLDFSNLKESTVLITGANGLIGGFLSDFVCYLNDEKRFNIKIFLTSFSKPSNAARIEHLLDRPDVVYFSWDSSKKIDIDNLPPVLDYCFFCSGYGQPSKFLKNNIKTSLLNVVGPESILSRMLVGGGNFLFLSTSEIYGDTPEELLPTPETYCGIYDLSNNRSAYKVSKSLGEVICKEYNNAPDMNVRIARVALTYGPGALRSDNRVLQEFIFKGSSGEIQMLDDGSSIRNYLYITDSVEVMMNIILHGNNLVYNVGGDTEPLSIFDIANTIGDIMKCKVKKGKSKNDNVKTAPKNVGLSMSKYRKEFEYGQNITPFKVGVLNTIRWFKYE